MDSRLDSRGGRSRFPLALALAVVSAAIGGTVAIGVARRGSDERARCGPGFVPLGAQCVFRLARDSLGALGAPAGSCPPPLARLPRGCDAPDVRVLVSEATLVLGPSDWEAEGRVAPRTVHAGPLRIDAFEVTRGAYETDAAETCGAPAVASPPSGSAARAMSGVTRDEASAFCARRAPGGRLPTEDEWIVAAVAGAGVPPRYPWGDTGAVCRRGAWGLVVGPCAVAADGPDTVGSHPDGDSALGIHDLAGNVAEWVAPSESASSRGLAVGGFAKGGSWQSALATDLRIWARLELDPRAHDARVGFRCVYPA